MSIDLYPHNQEAYDSALRMMGAAGKAAVIHPTGTGKSFIGFKLAEQNAGESVCWLSPSEYIFKTQIENLRSATNGYVPKNIDFITYAKLMTTDSLSIEGMRPGFIVLDEFHRCGAAEWGKGVKRLLAACPGVPLLGLSATNIRYLDNRRDMADELFDGCIASEMSLGEAIARGILLPPTYVLSVYAYQKELEYYQRKADSAKNGAVREKSKNILEKLRRAIADADGLDAVFEKHIKDKSGKYIVFCSNVEHMNEIAGNIGKWFSGVDKSPHVYRVYADEPSADKSFRDFKADESGHLKLLLCVDMLNEGVHVESVSGVIMFRLTSSPIIYKQQLGRALSAGKTKEPVVFDVVNNFDSLYSIGGIQEEMDEAIAFLCGGGKERYVVNRGFTVIDEVRDCRELFEAFNEALDATWDAYYEAAKAYYEEHGELDVPTTHRCGKLPLGKWIYSQRRIRNGEVNGHLTNEQIRRLEQIGMVWQPRRDAPWAKGIEHARAYREEFGNLIVPVDYASPDGYNLGGWIATQRQARSNNKRRGQLSEERIRQLDGLGMVWNRFELSFEQFFAEAEKYYEENGDLLVPVSFVSQNGVKLGAWVHKIRSARRGHNKSDLSEERIRRLESIGMQWNNIFEEKWEQGFLEAEQYYKANNTLKTTYLTVTESGFNLGKWLYSQKLAYNGYKGRKQLAPEKARRLEDIGMAWE